MREVMKDTTQYLQIEGPVTHFVLQKGNFSSAELESIFLANESLCFPFLFHDIRGGVLATLLFLDVVQCSMF